MPAYSIVIPTYNSAKTLSALLDSLEKQTFQDFEIIVVDDGSTDNTEDAVRDRPIRYIAMPQNAGPAAARNRGAELAEAEWLVFADADTVFEPETMESIHAILTKREMDALVGCYSGPPANDGFVPWYKGLWEYATIDETLTLDDDKLAPIRTWAPRPGLIKSRVFQTLGGFDTAFRGADLEDLELGYRLAAAGYSAYVSPAVRIRHHYPESIRAELVPFARRCALWMRMAVNRRELDSHGEGSGSQAIGHIIGFGTFCLAIAIPLFPPIGLIAIIALLAFLIANRRFIALAYRERGAIFAARAIVYCWLHSIVLGLAAAYGLITARRYAREAA